MWIYISIFLIILIVYASSSTSNPQTELSSVKTKIALISEESSPLIDGLKQELAKSAEFVNIPDNTEKLQDALYFREVEYIIRIPKGFTQGFMRGETVQLVKTIVPSSVSGAFMDMNINRYFNTARLYVKNTKGITQEQLVDHLKKDFSGKTAVEMKTASHVFTNSHYARNFFNYLAYSLLSVLILGISAIMLVFNNRDLQRRNFCSPIPAGSINMQFMLANFFFSFICWLIMICFYFLMDSQHASRANTLYFVLNSFVFAFCGSCISYLIGNLVKGRNSITALCNVVTLGTCFIGGVFVPQELLNSIVLKIASFTPTYWFVKANLQISALNNFDYASLSNIYYCMLVEFGFGVAFFAIALVIGKRKRMSN